MKFEDLGLAETLLRAVRAEGYETPTSIQTTAIPLVLQGRDVLGCAQTGTGKTAAFALPTLHRLSQAESRVNGRGRKIRCLVLSPTRELALQICESFQTYGRHTGVRSAAVFGGVSQVPQVRALNSGLDVLIATPGRLLDLMGQGCVELSRVECLILDEADRMLDMGFIPDLRRIIAKVPAQRQTLLFSATLPESIRDLARQWLRDPVQARVAPPSCTAERIQQSVYFIDKPGKLPLLTQWLGETPWTRALVFTRTKHGADKVVRHLLKAGIEADAFHSNKSQTARQRALARFKSPRPAVLVATDIAARGLDVDNVSHVVNFDLPDDPENYVHRVGRTARAGAAGVAVSFCSHDERSTLQVIQRLTQQTLSVEQHSIAPSPRSEAKAAAPARRPKNAPRSGARTAGSTSRPRVAAGATVVRRKTSRRRYRQALG